MRRLIIEIYVDVANKLSIRGGGGGGGGPPSRTCSPGGSEYQMEVAKGPNHPHPRDFFRVSAPPTRRSLSLARIPSVRESSEKAPTRR